MQCLRIRITIILYNCIVFNYTMYRVGQKKTPPDYIQVNKQRTLYIRKFSFWNLIALCLVIADTNKNMRQFGVAHEI